MILQLLLVTVVALEHEGKNQDFYKLSVSKVPNPSGDQILTDDTRNSFAKRNLRQSAKNVWIDNKEFVEPCIKHDFAIQDIDESLESLAEDKMDEDVKQDEEELAEEESPSEISEEEDSEEYEIIQEFNVPIYFDSDENIGEDFEPTIVPENETDDPIEEDVVITARHSIFQTISNILIKEKSNISNS